MAERAPAESGAAYRPADLLRQPGFLIDSVLAPATFVALSALAGIEVGAAAALALALAVLAVRKLRGEPLANGAFGLGGVLLAVLIALGTGSTEGYFVPKAISSGVLAVLFVASIVARRPAIGLLSVALYALPQEWLRDRRVRPAYSEITWAWAALFAGRALLFSVLIAAGEAGWLVAASFATGLPAFAVLLALSYPYVRWRLKRLGAPDPDAFAAAAATPAASAPPASSARSSG